MTFEQQNTFAKFLPLVHSTAKRFTRRGCYSAQYYDDLYNEGALALHQAVLSDDGCETFAFYARVRVRGAMLDHIRSLYWDRRMRRKARRVNGLQVFTLDQLPIDRATEQVFFEDAIFRKSLKCLTKKQRMILHLLYGRELKQVTLCKFLGVSEPRVNQLKNDILDKLRKRMK